MTCKLIMVEGLPGSGKSTHAKWIHEMLTEQGVDSQLYLEGNLNHPADYDGVAYYQAEEYRELLIEHEQYRSMLEQGTVSRGDHFFIPYRKLREAYGEDFSDELIRVLFHKDIYELPFEQNADLIVEKWIDFAQDAVNRNTTFIFECCFIQNPLTIGIVKNDVPKGAALRYVQRLEQAILKLEPVVIYVDQQDVARTFRKALQERPSEWSEGFMDYYTNQGYGKNRNLSGVEGTVEVLRHTRELALDIIDSLRVRTHLLDNTTYDPMGSKRDLREILNSLQIS